MFLLILCFLGNIYYVQTYQVRQLEQNILPCENFQQQFTDFPLSSISFYLTPDFIIQETTEQPSKNICDQGCPLNCCDNQSCQGSFNSNGNIPIPKSNYFIITGGFIDNSINVQECILTNKCFNLLNENIFYGNDKNFKIDILKVENYQPLYMHASVVVNRENQYWLYYIGGICQQQSDCNRLKRFRIPVKPIDQENFQSSVEILSAQLPINNPLIGSSLIYDEKKDRILLYGGSIVKGDNLYNQIEIFQFQFNNLLWQKLIQKEKIKKSIVINDEQKQFEVSSEKPQQIIYSLLTFNQDDQLMIIGGFNQEEFIFTWQQKIWIFDENIGLFKEVTPAYVYFDQKINFDIFYFPSQLHSRNGFTYLDYQLIADFSQFKQDAKRGYLYIHDENFIFIISQKVYKKNSFIEECFDQIQEYNYLTGEKLIYDCYANGKCKDKQCICEQNFGGSQCEIKQCLDNCNLENSPQNQCLSNFPQSYCHCDLTKNYGGLDCSMKFCINDCSFNGTCDYQNGKCMCDQNFKMRDCSVFEIEM